MELQSINSTLTLDLSKLRKAVSIVSKVVTTITTILCLLPYVQWRKTNDELVQSQNDLALSREEVRSLDRERNSLQQKVVTLQEAVDSPSCRTSLKRMLERYVSCIHGIPYIVVLKQTLGISNIIK